MTLRRDDYGIARIEKGSIEAWNQGNGWRITDNGYTVVTFWLDETRERKMDWTGYKEYRVVTKQKVKFEFRLSYGLNVTLDDGCEFYGGEGKTVRRIIELYEDGWFERESKWAAERMARKAGASELAIITAINGFDIYEDDSRKVDAQIARNLMKLA